ncbi:MAG: DegT/DnrJ/EryC1/StrS family aminotransferase [Candidatus Thermoplasmatota archaeon]|nr:DegT/DnrJ/EryC1/StrS family aminotransferase [Candidatus Thermoplasmatota archaeon]
MIPIAKPQIGDEEKKAVMEVLNSGIIASGPKVKEFEKTFAQFVGTKHAIATSNGTTALHAALFCAGIEPGDEVITTPFTFIATANAILFCGAKPVFADIDLKTFNIDPASVRRKITKKTKAILPVHLYGQSAAIEEIMAIAKEHDLKVIEDCAQSHGAMFGGKKVGSFGDAGCFSFYPTKNMTTSEGGMITTNDDALAEKIRIFINQGMKERYVHIMIGHNFRMTDIGAAIGIEQFKKLEGFTAKRQANAKKLNEMLAGSGVVTPYVAPGCNHVYHQYTIQTENREALMNFLHDKGIGYGIYYPKALHQYEHLAKYGNKRLKNAEKAALVSLSLPVHPALSDADVVAVATAIKEFMAKK